MLKINSCLITQNKTSEYIPEITAATIKMRANDTVYDIVYYSLFF